MNLTIKILEKKYYKSNFSCGYSLLDDYIKRQARHDVSRDLSACYVLLDESETVKGYYTLSANSIRKEDFSETLQKKWPPNYQDIPTILLGRLAVDNSLKGKGDGQILLIDALKRSYEIAESLGTLAVVVDTIDAIAKGFYAQYGFILLPTSGKMFLAVKTIRELFNDITQER